LAIDSVILSVVIATVGSILFLLLSIDSGSFTYFDPVRILFDLTAFPLVVGLVSFFYYPASEVYQGARARV